MPKKVVLADQAAAPGGPYSPAVIAGDHAFLAGACPVLPDGTWVRGSFAEQARAAFRKAAKRQLADRDVELAILTGNVLDVPR